MQAVLAWIWGPALVLAICFGLGLLAERVVRAQLPAALLAPVGLALLTLLTLAVYKLALPAPVAAAGSAAAALAGVVLARDGLRERLPDRAAWVALLAVYVLYLAPVALSGEPGWAGYNFVNDASSHMVFADLLEREGIQAPDPRQSTTATFGARAVISSYPLGAHGVLAAVSGLSGVDLSSLYHPLLALFAGLAALGFAEVARRAGLGPRAAAAAGALAMTGALPYAYLIHGSLKEAALIALLAAAAGLATAALDRDLPLGLVALMAICALAMVTVFSAVAAPYALVLGVGMLGAALTLPRDRRPSPRRVARVAAAGIGVGLVAAIPLAPSVLAFASHASDVFANVGGLGSRLGHLLRPIPLEQAAGVWLARDYRGAVSGGLVGLNSVLIVGACALALVGIAAGLLRRRPAVALLVATVALPIAVLAPGLAPYADAKLLLVLSPAVALAAAVGAFSLAASPRAGLRMAGIVAGLAVAAGALASDALVYRATRVPDLDRMRALEDAARHAGTGLVLHNEWEEYAKYFMREAHVNVAFESSSPRLMVLRRPAPTFGRFYDLDRERLSHVMSFPGIVIRRSPSASRPPAAFRLTHQNEFYEVWRRRPGIPVREHLSLQGDDRATAVPSCAAVRALAGRARPGERLVAARRGPTQVLQPLAAGRPAGWAPTGEPPGTIIPAGSGEATFTTYLPAGSYRPWLQGTTGRELTLSLDGRELGRAGEVNTPDQFLSFPRVRLEAGTHTFTLRRPGPSLAPGDGFAGTLGALVLEPPPRAALVSVGPRRAASLCGRAWDWIELVGGRGR